jgi:RNA polymerase sigma-70 factor (ECF subfamily)
VPATEDPSLPEPREPDDRALLSAHVGGDPSAFGALFARHRDRLWAVALRTTGDPEEAADALQDAMVAAFRRADSYRGDAAVTTWLHRIVVNACLDRLRRRKVRAADPLPDQPEEEQDRATHSSGSVDPAAAAEQADLRTRVRAALDRLPVDQRVALVLVDVEGYSVDEVARLVDAAPGTVKSRCSRGRARLRVLLEESGVTPGNPIGAAHVPSTAPDPPGTGAAPTRRPRPTAGGDP